MIEKISFLLAKKLLQNTDKDCSDTEELEILKYGIECIINILIPISFFTIYSLLQNILLKMICWLITFLLLRNIIGGYHAGSHCSCIILSILYGILSLFMLQYMSNFKLYIKLTTLAMIFIMHRLSAPIIHREEKQTDKYIQQTRYRTNVMLLLLSALILSLHFYALSISNAIWLGMINAEILFIIKKTQA